MKREQFPSRTCSTRDLFSASLQRHQFGEPVDPPCATSRRLACQHMVDDSRLQLGSRQRAGAAGRFFIVDGLEFDVVMTGMALVVRAPRCLRKGGKVDMLTGGMAGMLAHTGAAAKASPRTQQHGQQQHSERESSEEIGATGVGAWTGTPGIDVAMGAMDSGAERGVAVEAAPDIDVGAPWTSRERERDGESA